MEKIIVGIDFGTTNSVVSIFDENEPKTLKIDGAKLLPSVVSLSDDGFIVGQTAKNIAILEPEKTISSIKRKMGQNITIPIGTKSMRPEEITALILQKIRLSVIEHFNFQNDEIIRTVITIPAYFTEEQREATKQAAELAHFKVERIINEPTAAALAFGISGMNDAVYGIYDLGGGTFDISIIENIEGVVEVLATTGDSQLGGDDFDKLLTDFIWKKFITKNKLKNLERTKKINARLFKIAEQTKIKLSNEENILIEENFFVKHKDISYHLEIAVAREEFENLIKNYIEKTIELLLDSIKDADLEIKDIDGIILVGGSSRIPLVTKLIYEKLNILPVLINLPDEAVAHGASIQGAIIDNKQIDTVLVDITPYSLGIAVVDHNFLDEYFSPDSNFEENDFLMAAKIIPKNTPLPVKRSKKFQSIVNFQKEYEIKVFQGEKKKYHDNKKIGKTYLKVKKPIEDGEIDVTFELDINGLLNITAIETTTKEIVQTKFKSSKGIKINKSKFEKLQKLSPHDSHSHTLKKRAKTLLNSENISMDDKNELFELIEKYENATTENREQFENQLLDLLYFLEEDEH